MTAEKMSAGEVLAVLDIAISDPNSSDTTDLVLARIAVAAMAEREADLLKEHEEDQGVIAVWRGRCERAEAERDALIAENEALEAVLYLHECPSCGIEWSESECEQMIRKKSAGCICGYRQELARAEAGHG